MAREITFIDVIEAVDRLKTREKAHCDEFIALNPAYKEVRERERFIYEMTLNDLLTELGKKL